MKHSGHIVEDVVEQARIEAHKLDPRRLGASGCKSTQSLGSFPSLIGVLGDR